MDMALLPLPKEQEYSSFVRTPQKETEKILVTRESADSENWEYNIIGRR